jgi:CRISPR-associated protein Csx14
LEDPLTVQSVLIATLGTEPQIIPITVQLLLQRNVSLVCVDVLHTIPDQKRITASLQSVQASFQTHPEWPTLKLTRVASHDVLTPEELDTFSTALFTTLKGWIHRNFQIHLLLAGGRKPMAMLGMSIAQMLLGQEDRVWYLFSNEDLRLSGRTMLTNTDDARLISIPLPMLSSAPSPFGRSFQAETPEQARQELNLAAEERRRFFVEQELTPSERKVAQLIVQEVMTVEDIAERLHKTPKTVTNQLNSIYSKMESVFGLQADVGLKREFLRRELSPYFDP